MSRLDEAGFPLLVESVSVNSMDKMKRLHDVVYAFLDELAAIDKGVTASLKIGATHVKPLELHFTIDARMSAI